MAINFPSPANTNDAYTLGGKTWKFNGNAWELQPLTAGYTGSKGDIGYTGSSATLIYSSGSFTGDGSTVNFTINSGRAVNNILVFVNGLCLMPTDDYTIASTTLTFITAPGASAEIQVRYLPI